jgi:mercuric ion binding protein
MVNLSSLKSRNIVITIMLFVFLSLSISLITYAVTRDGDKTETIKISTMVCDLCVDRLNKAIGSIEGVRSVNVDLKNKQAVVTFDESLTSLGKIEDMITATGYEANNKKADQTAFDKLPGCCKFKEKAKHEDMKMNDSMNGSMDGGCSNNSKGCMSNHKGH